MSQPIVHVIDDDVAVRDGLRLLCETVGLAVECHDSAESFLDALRPDQPGCVVLDVRMGGMSGPELHAELVRRDSRLPVIYLTAHGDIPMTVRAMKAGAMDFLTKPVDSTELLDHIRAALGRSAERLTLQQALAAQRQRLLLLTPREREVLALVVAGHSNKVIAQRLGISHRTVELHRSHVLHKTGAGSLLELAQLAADCGIAIEVAAQAGEPPPAGSGQ
jgi:FixJ family two-component response regulator